MMLTERIEEQDHTAGLTVIESAALHDRNACMQARVGGALTFDAAVVHIHQLDDPALVKFMRTRSPTVASAHAYTACPAGFYYFTPGHECTRPRGPGCVGNMLFGGCLHARDPRKLPSRYRQSGRALQALREADLTVSYSRFVDRYLATNAVARRATVPYFPTVEPRPSAGGERRRVVFAGRIVDEKGVHVLLRAAREVAAEFVICGKGRRLAAMRKLASDLGVADRVRFRGWLSAEALARELAEASVLALPSLWPEPFGLVGIEAHCAGRPVVASDTGGVRDWLDDGVSGVLVPPGDADALARALGQLLADPRRQDEMGAAGRATVAARYSRERHVASLLAGYDAARSHWLAASGR
jgi:glycosyltransferase involved in cell wall biosynthesis